MKIPKQIKAGSRIYKVVIDKKHDLAEHNLDGETRHETQTIIITPIWGSNVERDTLWHELLHCAARMTNLDRQLGEEAAEDVVERMETALLTILLDNKGLLEYIKDPE